MSMRLAYNAFVLAGVLVLHEFALHLLGELGSGSLGRLSGLSDLPDQIEERLLDVQALLSGALNEGAVVLLSQSASFLDRNFPFTLSAEIAFIPAD